MGYEIEKKIRLWFIGHLVQRAGSQKQSARLTDQHLNLKTIGRIIELGAGEYIES